MSTYTIETKAPCEDYKTYTRSAETLDDVFAIVRSIVDRHNKVYGVGFLLTVRVTLGDDVALTVAVNYDPLDDG